MVLVQRKPSLTRKSFDWTRGSRPTRDFEKCTRENVEWANSPLGRFEEWPADLRRMVLVSMADTSASAVVYSGAVVYNEAFAELIGKRHPHLQGQIVQDELLDLCPEFDVVWKRQAETGRTEKLENQRIRRDKLGFVEEKSYCWKFLPIVGEDGDVVGSLVTVEDESKTMPRRERSKSAVRELGNVVKTAIDRTASQTAANILRLDEHFSGRTCNCSKLWEVQRQLEATEERREKFGNLAPVGIVTLQDDDGYSIEWANLAYWDIMAQSLETKSFLEYVHPDDVAMVQGQLELGSFHQSPYSFQCRLKKWAARAAVSPAEAVPKATPAWILVSAFKDPEHDNVTMCWIIDITSHKSAEAFLRQRMDEALEMKQQKERFIDQISHEVRNPLSAMLHCTDDIIANVRQSNDQLSADVLEAAQTIAFCTNHIKTIVDDVLTLSKLDSRLVGISPVPARPREVVERAITIFQSELKASSISLSFVEDISVQDLAIDWLLIDPVRYLQVLFNMVTNAIKVVKGQRERIIKVTLSAARDNQVAGDGRLQFVKPRAHFKPVDFGQEYKGLDSVFLVTTVEDTGPGLCPDAISSLFERFAQASPKTESKYGGSGLGLFISRDLTELQGGRIGVASEAGAGSTFVFSVESKRCEAPKTLSTEVPSIHIPAGLLQGPTMEADHSPVLDIPPESPHISSQDADQKDTAILDTRPETLLPSQVKEMPRPRRILVVEDNHLNQKILATQLRKRGYIVSVALHGAEALKQLHIPLSHSIPRKPAEFDVVLMDIEMPIMNGIQCVQRIREFEAARGRRSRVPIIAVTANARSEHGMAAIEAGMDSITTKPYKIEELVGRIESVCGQMTEINAASSQTSLTSDP